MTTPTKRVGNDEMTHYTAASVVENGLIEGDTVVLNGDEYLVADDHLSNSGGNNDAIFDYLGLDADEFCDEHYDYENEGGSWPCYHDEDFEAAANVVIALFRLLEEKSSGSYSIASLSKRIAKLGDEKAALLRNRHKAEKELESSAKKIAEIDATVTDLIAQLTTALTEHTKATVAQDTVEQDLAA